MSARGPAAAALALLLLALALGWAVPRLMAPADRMSLAMTLLESGRAREAAYLFEDPVWRGVAEHRAGRHRRAAAAFLTVETAETLYDAGVAYAHLHEWGAAKAAFRKALRLQPDHADARHNLAVVERAEAAEERALAESRGEAEGGGVETGDRSADGGEPEGGETLEPGEAEGGKTQAAERESDEGGRGEGGGLPGEEIRSDDAEGGTGAAATEAAEGPAPEGLSASAAAIRRESALAAEILLRRIEDDPARVLASRLRAAHELRAEREAAR